MLSVEQCKSFLINAGHTDEQTEEIRAHLYQLAEILISGFFAQNGSQHGNKQADRGK